MHNSSLMERDGKSHIFVVLTLATWLLTSLPGDLVYVARWH